jgi:hypothetical protein
VGILSVVVINYLSNHFTCQFDFRSVISFTIP